MVDYNAPLYQHPQERWDAKKCERLVKRIAKDSLGTKYPFPGYVSYGELGGHYVHGMSVRYNGGCIREDEWYQGEEWPMPLLPDGFKFVYVTSWGYRLIKLPKTPTCETKPNELDDKASLN